MRREEDTSPDVLRSRELNRRCDEWTNRQVEYANNGTYKPGCLPYITHYLVIGAVALIALASIIGLVLGRVHP